MKILFDFDAGKCSACGACAVACMDQNDLDVSGGQAPYRKVYQDESPAGELFSISVSCLHCSDAPCVAACPVGCLYKDQETGLTLYHNQNCVGCHACATACPYGALSFRNTGGTRPREKMEKCDGCVERIRAGMVPACVRSCPTGALTWRWAEDGEVNSFIPVYERLQTFAGKPSKLAADR